MELLKALYEEAAARDISAYYSQVKRSLGKDPKFKLGKVSRAAIASVIHDIAENDPDSTINAGALVSGVFAKYKAQYGAAKPVAAVNEGMDTDNMPGQSGAMAEPKLSSKDRSFEPDAAIGGEGAPDMEDGGDVEELKMLRNKDIGDTLTPEQQEELETLRSQSTGDGECMDDECCDPDCPEHGKPVGMSSDSMSVVKEGWDAEEEEEATPAKLSPKAQAAMMKRLKAGNKEKKDVAPPSVPKSATKNKMCESERAEALKQFGSSLLSGLTRKDGSFLK